MSSMDLAVNCLTFFLYAFISSLNYIDASRFAGDSMFGSFNIEITLIKIASTPRMGLHLSSAVSYAFILSSPGGCKMEIHTLPSGYILGCHILVLKIIFGGLFG